MEDRGKGTVTSLSSLFPAEEALKASKRVHEAIAERKEELKNLQTFIAENADLVKLVQRLPDELHHNIMVPFGKAAFFPGRLIHSNEFLVLLGDSYYAERSSKQTIEILKRRGRTLDTQVDSLKAMVEDLKVEASFFDTTASEAAEGLVEIREEYIGDDVGQKVTKTGDQTQEVASVSGANDRNTFDDEEYARIMSRFDELEEEELEAEGAEEQDDSERNEDLGNLDVQNLKDEYGETEEHDCYELERVNFLTLQEETASKATASVHGVRLKSDQGCANIGMKTSFQSVPKTKDQDYIQMSEADVRSRMSKSATDSFKGFVQKPEADAFSQMSKSAATDSLKAFTCSIIERTDNLPTNSDEQTRTTNQPPSQPSKPVSRFKMQRR